MCFIHVIKMNLRCEILFLCAAFVTASICSEIDLKIDYNVTSNEQASVDKLNIQFINKQNPNNTVRVNNIMNDGKWSFPRADSVKFAHKFGKHLNQIVDSYEKHPKHKQHSTRTVKLIADAHKFDSDLKERNAEKNHLEAIDNVAKRVNVIDFKLQNENFERMQRSNERIKDNLDKFAMIRRNTYISTPDFEYPKSMGNNRKDINNLKLENDNYNANRENNENSNDRLKRKSKFYDNFETRNRDFNEHGHTKRAADIKFTKLKSEERDDNNFADIFTNPKLVQILRKQTELIEKLENYLKTNERTKKSDFDDLIASMERRKNTTDITSGDRITEVTTLKATPVISLIDETQVRESLKKDPLVKRILKMANRKKIEYMKQAKKYYNNLLYY